MNQRSSIGFPVGLFFVPTLIGQRQFWRKPSVFATRSVSEGLWLTRPLADASGYYLGKSELPNYGIQGFQEA